MGLLASAGRAEAGISHRMTVMQCRQLSPPFLVLCPSLGDRQSPAGHGGRKAKDNSVSHTLSISLLQQRLNPTIATSQGELLERQIRVWVISSTFFSSCTHPTSTGSSN